MKCSDRTIRRLTDSIENVLFCQQVAKLEINGQDESAELVWAIIRRTTPSSYGHDCNAGNRFQPPSVYEGFREGDLGKTISLFSGYSQRENRTTNYCLLVLKLLYEENPRFLGEVLEALLGENISDHVGVQFRQQEKRASRGTPMK